jgi:hypothetical protein
LHLTGSKGALVPEKTSRIRERMPTRDVDDTWTAIRAVTHYSRLEQPPHTHRADIPTFRRRLIATVGAECAGLTGERYRVSTTANAHCAFRTPETLEIGIVEAPAGGTG